jgi:hypothetical protein
MVLVAEVLHGSRPVDIREKALIAETESLHDFGRADVENFFQARAGGQSIDSHQSDNRANQKKKQEPGRQDCSLAAGSHFKFRCSKISTAPLSAIAE